MATKSVKGTQTELNLMKSFAGESQARTRYTLFAKVAQKEGYEQIASIFLETADNELHHAKLFFSYLDEGNIEITAAYPAGPVADTLKNLQEAAMGEHEEWADLYNNFAQVAAEEGFPQISSLFKLVSSVEQHHEARYNQLIERIKSDHVFTDDDASCQWQCRVCGYIHTGKTAPKVCPLCKHPQGFFQREQENF